PAPSSLGLRRSPRRWAFRSANAPPAAAPTAISPVLSVYPRSTASAPLATALTPPTNTSWPTPCLSVPHYSPPSSPLSDEVSRLSYRPELARRIGAGHPAFLARGLW